MLHSDLRIIQASVADGGINGLEELLYVFAGIALACIAAAAGSFFAWRRVRRAMELESVLPAGLRFLNVAIPTTALLGFGVPLLALAATTVGLRASRFWFETFPEACGLIAGPLCLVLSIAAFWATRDNPRV